MSIKQGEYLKKLRIENNLSQEKLGEKLGLSRQSVSKWEQGNASPDIDNIMKLASLYNVSVESILSGEEDVADIKNEYKADSLNADANNKTVEENSVKNEKQGTENQSQNLIENAEKQSEKENGENEKPAKKKKHRGWFFVSYPVLMCIAYVLLGIFYAPQGWYYGWLVFLTIPLYYTFVIAAEKHKPIIFCYPVLMVLVYLIGGFFYSLWHPLWIIFLTIPLFYIICAKSKHKNK